MKLMKRAAAGLLAVLLLATAGCAGSSKGFAPKLDKNADVQLTIQGYFGNFEALDQVMNDFNKYYPKVTFTYQQVGGADEESFLESNKEVDLIMTSSDLLHRNGGTLADHCVNLLEQDVDLSAIDEKMLLDSNIGGKQLSIPMGQNMYGMVVNLTLLEKEGLSLPKNQTEFLNVLSALKSKGYTPIQGPTSKVYAEAVGNIFYSGMCEGQPIRQALEQGDMDAAEAAVLPAFQLIETMVKEGYTDLELNGEYPDDNYDQAILRFFEGNVPFWVCNTEKVSGMKKRESKSEAFQQEPFSYTFIFPPVGEDGQYIFREPWFGFAANKTAKNLDYAVEFLRFLATRDEINQMADVKRIPSAAKVSTGPDVYVRVLDKAATDKSIVNKGEVTPAMTSKWYSCIAKFAQGGYDSAHEAIQDLLSVCLEEI